MSFLKNSDDLQPLAPGTPLSEGLTVRRLNAIMETLRDLGAGKHLRGGRGVRVRGGPHGMTISGGKAGRSVGSSMHPWKATGQGDIVVMTGGAYNSIAIGQQELEGTGWAYLAATWDVTDVEDGYLLSAELVSVVFATDENVPANVPTSGLWHVPLVQFDEGAVLSQAATRSIVAQVCDGGFGDGRGTHTILQS